MSRILMRGRVLLGLVVLPYSGCRAADLTVADVANTTGDGPDGKGNTADDTWQFWFELAHKPGHFHPLDTFSTSVPRQGVSRKITGPIAAMLLNPDDTE